MPGMLRRACDYANARVEQYNGPEYQAGQNLIAEWQFLRRGVGIAGVGIGASLYLDFIHDVSSVVSVQVNDYTLDEHRWNKRGDSGIEIRNYNPWNLSVTAEYTPKDNNMLRDGIAMQLALLFIGFQSGALPQASGVREPGVTTRGVRDVSTQERRALARLDPRQTVIRLPDSTYPKVSE